jgi:hypothetical protein
LRKDASNLIQNIPLSQQYEFVVKNVLGAKSHGIESIDEVKLYCVVALMMGEEFMSGPTWTSAMRAAKCQSGAFASVVASLDLDNYLDPAP